MAAYLALIDADCPGYTNLSQAQINEISAMCDHLSETDAVYGCTDPDAINYDSTATTPCNSGTDNDCCEYSISGCTDINANNYNQSATTPCNSGTENDCCEY